MVQNTGFGETCCRHFLNSLRTLEAEAGRRICETKKLRTKVEVDATNLLSFHVSAKNAHYAQQIRALENMLQKKGLRKDSVYVAHVQVLGAVERGGHAIVHLSQPRVTPKGQSLNRNIQKLFFEIVVFCLIIPHTVVLQ